MHKWILSTLITIACAMGVYLMATGLPDKPVDEASELAEGQELLKIEATNFDFNEKEYRVKAGTNYKVKFSNTLGTHGVEFVGLDLELTKDNPETVITFDKPGTYELQCSIMCGQGHASMKSVLIVE
ncbi:cupredoxin domain-containing protein [Cohnella luojiensis]|uniref:Cytochrome C oxidase subunit II n=1 Tax=Cohnella luojiensis TaxID=652876 RepID=A0A4Y8M6F2_9BACL|nr:cupredoxin domain-containing protein [Cohnella luojiensis]TFE31550.1 cytochrome C oxidase subunit II [Cohnella luojiensis]